MLFIVAGHSVIHGINEISLTVNGMLAIVLTQGSRIGVDLFILITGYFSVGKEVTVKKIKKLYIQIITYSLIITIVMCVLGETSVSSLIYALLSVVTSRYWFVTCYVMLILLSPALQIKIILADRGNRACQLLLSCGTITNDNDFIYCFHILRHLYMKSRLVSNLYFSSNITYIGTY